LIVLLVEYLGQPHFLRLHSKDIVPKHEVVEDEGEQWRRLIMKISYKSGTVPSNHS